MSAAIDHAAQFGFPIDALPRNETLALGTLVATPLQMATAFAVFANGGYRVEPYLIDRIESAAGESLYRAAPKVVCRTCESPPVVGRADAPLAAAATDTSPEGAVATPLEASPAPALPTPSEYEAATRWQALVDRRSADAPPGLAALASVQGGRGYLHPDRIAPRAISPANAWLMSDIMRDVVRRGTAQRARALNREDIGGKTGTSNNDRDAWFNGFNQRLVATAWVGFDDEHSLGEESSSTAVPVWVHFMREALRGTPDQIPPMPPGLVRLRVNPRTGALADPLDPEAVSEIFMVEHQPQGAAPGSSVTPGPGLGGTSDPLF
jgi:penicillin-binding protein 1A